MAAEKREAQRAAMQEQAKKRAAERAAERAAFEANLNNPNYEHVPARAPKKVRMFDELRNPNRK